MVSKAVSVLKVLTVILGAFFVIPMTVRAQGPLTPPARPPVPMTVSDEPSPRSTDATRKPTLDAKSPQLGTQPASAAETIRVPLASTSRHISTGNAAFDEVIYEAAGQNGLDPCLIVSVMRAESGFNRMAVSPKGASGLMQLMPATAERFGVKNIFDVRENILAGAKYLRWLLDRFDGDVRLALAGYNAGEGAVELYGYRIPPFLETQNYVRTIYTRYSGLHLGATTGMNAPTLNRPVVEAAKIPDPSPDSNPSYNQIIRFTATVGDTPKGGN
jgi:transglycosylase-like protein with SLT domain